MKVSIASDHAGFEEKDVVLLEVVLGDVDGSVRCSADQERIDTAGDFTWVTAVFVHEFTTGISDHVIAIRAINNRYIILFHLNKSIEIRCKVSTFF